MAQSLANKSRLLEKYMQVVREDGLNTNKNVNIGINGATPNVWIAGNLSVGGTFTPTGALGPTIITATSVNAFTVGPSGITNPTFNIDTHTTSAVTGLNVVSQIAGQALKLSVLSSASNENLNIDALGTGSVVINSVATGQVALKSRTAITVAHVDAFDVGPNGTTNPTFRVKTDVASTANGLLVAGSAASSGLAITTLSTATDENLTISAKGAGTTTVNSTAVATAGGAINDGVMYGSIGVGVFTGTGAPTFSAMNGSIYTDSNATTTTTRIYINKSGAGTAGTTWTALTTAA